MDYVRGRSADPFWWYCDVFIQDEEVVLRVRS